MKETDPVREGRSESPGRTRERRGHNWRSRVRPGWDLGSLFGFRIGDHSGSGGRGKKRPVVVVQADVYNQRLRSAIVAQITTNLTEKNEPACLFIEAATAEGKAAGLDRDCLICCTLLSLMTEDRLKEKIGKLPAELLTALDQCLKSALGIA